MVVGALLLLVTTSDLYGVPAQPAEWLAEPAAPAPQLMSEGPPPSAPEAAPLPTVAAFLPTATAFAAEGAFGIMADEQEGTSGGDRASEEMLADEDLAAPAPRAVASSVAAAVTQAAPTAAAGLAPGAAQDEPAASAAKKQPALGAGEPSRLRLVQIALAFALAWLVVSIAGLRWVRGQH
jgi:hypothetical protein